MSSVALLTLFLRPDFGHGEQFNRLLVEEESCPTRRDPDFHRRRLKSRLLQRKNLRVLFELLRLDRDLCLVSHAIAVEHNK